MRNDAVWREFGRRYPYDFVPGPWRVEDSATGNLSIRTNGPYGSSLLAVIVPPEGWSLAHQDANAKLMAASPNLLKALYSMLETFGDPFAPSEAERDAREAIREALGE